MKFLKPILIGSFAFLALSLNAQTSNADAAIAQLSQERINNLATELALTPEQISEIQSLNEKVIHKIEAIRDNATMDEAKKNEFIRGNQADHKRVMSTILTPEQYATYEVMMKPKAEEQGKSIQKEKNTF